MNDEDVAALVRRGETFDIQGVPGTSAADLDVARFRSDYLPNAVAPEIIEENHRPLEQQLAALRMLTPDGLVTILGLLTLANDPLRHLPGAFVQFLRFDGTELTDPIVVQQQVSGPLAQMIGRLDDLISAHIRTSIALPGPKHVTPSDYPAEALRQVIRNAVMHRAYDGTDAPVKISWFTDRIEVMNPGGPYGQVTIESFGQPGLTDYRNPHIAEALKVMGFVERFGMGLSIANKRLRENGNPPLGYDVRPNFVLIRLHRSTP